MIGRKGSKVLGPADDLSVRPRSTPGRSKVRFATPSLQELYWA
jgi:hypothetical protein